MRVIGEKTMSLNNNVAINIKYFRKKYKLSQEKFSEVLGTSLHYLNQIEKGKVDLKLSTLDKFTDNINAYDKKANLQYEDLVVFNPNHITNFKRIDERTPQNSKQLVSVGSNIK